MDKLLKDTLGEDGAAAVEKAVASRTALSGAIHPRAALAWVRAAMRRGFSGTVPGTPELNILVKTDSWEIPDLDMKGTEETGLAALLVALTGTVPVATPPPLQILVKLGKNLDALAISAFDRANPIPGKKRSRVLNKIPEKVAAEKLTPSSRPLPSRGVRVVLKKSEVEHNCSACGKSQVREKDLVGCHCFVEVLSKADVIIPIEDGYIVRWLGEDNEEANAFLRALRYE